MTSPRRARSLFLSPNKAELLAAKEVNNLLHRVHVVPPSRKPVPTRQSATTSVGGGDEKRVSTTSTISTVDAFFCREYRPPSIALHRLSYLDKELPPPPPLSEQTEARVQEEVGSHASRQRNAAVQTVISIQSRYSTQLKPAPRRSLSTISSQQRKSEDRISIRSQYSTQDYAIGQDVPVSEPRARGTVDRRRRLVGWDLSTQDVRRRDSGRISPGTVTYRERKSADGGGKVKGFDCAEVDAQASKGVRDPLTSTESKDDDNVVVRSKSKSKSKSSVTWTFSDGIVLRTEEDRSRGTTAVAFSGGESLALQPTLKRMKPIRWTFHDGLILRSADKSQDIIAMTAGGQTLAVERKPKAMIPIRWTFHDGFVLKAVEVLGDNDGIVEAESKGISPISWSFHDGFIFRPDGSVKVASKATDGSKEVVRGGMLPIGWTFHDGFIFRPDGPTEVASSKASTESELAVRDESQSKRLISIGWSFHDGFTINPDGAVKVASNTTAEGIEVVPGGNKSRTVMPFHWTFHDGFTIRPEGAVKVASQATDVSDETIQNENMSKQLTWTFHDGFTIRPDR